MRQITFHAHECWNEIQITKLCTDQLELPFVLQVHKLEQQLLEAFPNGDVEIVSSSLYS